MEIGPSGFRGVRVQCHAALVQKVGYEHAPTQNLIMAGTTVQVNLRRPTPV